MQVIIEMEEYETLKKYKSWYEETRTWKEQLQKNINTFLSRDYSTQTIPCKSYNEYKCTICPIGNIFELNKDLICVNDKPRRYS